MSWHDSIGGRRTKYQYSAPPKANANTTGDLFGVQAPRIAKLVRLLSSPIDGEVIAAARSLNRVTDIHHLADSIENNYRDPVVVEVRPPPPPPPPKRRPEWQLQAEALLQFADNPRIIWGSRELDFLRNMAKSRFAPTQGQQKMDDGHFDAIEITASIIGGIDQCN